MTSLNASQDFLSECHPENPERSEGSATPPLPKR
jgi:hypothetical protein